MRRMAQLALLPVALVILFLAVFFLECLSTDVVSTVVYAVPFIILFFVTLALFKDLGAITQGLIAILALVNAIVIAANLLKAIISS